ncbi:GNAT family N-acetyltransferase [Listeria costaricensis]|uniref:GNAT family N-acetyltransferase n=1 Tax=Listeria costaricensis TaxID=2026604 RepID=UPI000C07E566|nr:GNAT family N-acetyltransferase [Listeria costaricensis]
MRIREITAQDNPAIERVIRDVLIEYQLDRPGTAWEDASLSQLSDYYEQDGRAYWVIEVAGEIVGGVGIGPFGDAGVAELQKLYLKKEARGKGYAGQLVERALDFAASHYKACYLETVKEMDAARRLYLRNGFVELASPLAGSVHHSMDRWYLKTFEQE